MSSEQRRIAALETALRRVPELKRLAMRWQRTPVAIDKGDGCAHSNPECRRLADAVEDLEAEIMAALKDE